MSHTPEPWHLWCNEETGAFQIFADADLTTCICARNDWDHRAKESTANGRLLVAAPDLLAALQQLVADYECVPDPSDKDGQAVFEDARAAIAKAAPLPLVSATKE